MAVQGSLNTALSKVVGLWEATFVVHATGTVVLLVVLFLLKMGRGDLGNWSQAPWYSYLGGVISVFIIYLVAPASPTSGLPTLPRRS
jgi:transporter family-2 protein